MFFKKEPLKIIKVTNSKIKIKMSEWTSKTEKFKINSAESKALNKKIKIHYFFSLLNKSNLTNNLEMQKYGFKTIMILTNGASYLINCQKKGSVSHTLSLWKSLVVFHNSIILFFHQKAMIRIILHSFLCIYWIKSIGKKKLKIVTPKEILGNKTLLKKSWMWSKKDT